MSGVVGRGLCVAGPRGGGCGRWVGGCPRMSVSFLAVGSEVDAGGIIGARVVKGPSSTVVLQQRVGSRWIVRASGKLSRHGRSYGFSVKWLGAPAAGGVAVRVQLLRGRVVLARSATRVVRSSSVVSVQRTLRPSTVQPAASSVVGVSGSPYGQTVVVLGAVPGSRWSAVRLCLKPRRRPQPVFWVSSRRFRAFLMGCVYGPAGNPRRRLQLLRCASRR